MKDERKYKVFEYPNGRFKIGHTDKFGDHVYGYEFDTYDKAFEFAKKFKKGVEDNLDDKILLKMGKVKEHDV